MTKKLIGIYCEKSLYKANVDIDFHTKNSHPEHVLPYFDTTKPDVQHALMSFKLAGVDSKLVTSSAWKARDEITEASKVFRQLLEGMAGDCSSQQEIDTAIWLEEPECGGGCTISFMIKPILYALKHRVKLVTPRSRWLSGKHHCNKNDISCFLRSYASRYSCGTRPKKSKDKNGQWRLISQDDEAFFQAVSGEKSIPSEYRKYGSKC